MFIGTFAIRLDKKNVMLRDCKIKSFLSVHLTHRREGVKALPRLPIEKSSISEKTIFYC